MAARRGRVAVSITADNSQLKRGVKDSERNLGRLQRVGVSSTRGLSAGFKAAGGIIAGAAVADQIRQTIVAAQESEVSNKKMQAQLKALGISYRAHAKEIDNVIQKTSKLSGLDDEDLQDSFTAIVRATGNVKDGLHGTALAADLARAKHMDVAKAGDLVAKVYNGNVGALKRMGIALTPVTTAQDKLKETTKHATVEQTRAAKEADKTATAQKALGELQKRVGGQAAAYGKTSAGAQDRFRVAVENLREKIGEKLLPILTKVTDKVTKFVEQMTDGTGAGGRFADKLKAIADRMKPIVKFFADHPKIIALAIGAWAAYRVAAALAMAATRLKALGMFKGLARPAAIEGAKAGTAFGGAASTSAGETFGRRAPGALRGGKLAAGMRGAGTALGAVAGAAMIGELISRIEGDRGTILNTIRGLIPFQPTPGTPHVTPYKPSKGAPPYKKGSGPLRIVDDPLPGGSPTGATPLKKPPGLTKKPPRAHGASVRAHAAASTGGAQPHPDDIVAAVTERANRIDAAHVPYQWGGGHGGRVTGGKVIPMDCSGAVSAALGIDPRVSGDFASWGSPGDGGSSGVTVYANRTHVLMKINGRFWGTSRSNPGGGAGWIDGGVSPGYLSGFTARHMAGTTSRRPAAGASFLAGVRKAVRRPTATLGGTLSRAPSSRVGHTAATGDKGFTQTNEGAEPTQGQTDIKRQFQIGVRLQEINRLLPTAKGGKRAALLAERGRLTTELAGIGQSDATGTAKIPGADAYLGSLDRAEAEAALTPDTADDVAVAKSKLTAAQNIYDYEKQHPDQFSDADVADAARNLKAARDVVDQPANDALQANTEALNAVKDELKRTNDLNEHILGVTSGQWQKAFADVVNGQIGGFVDARGRTAGDGTLARY